MTKISDLNILASAKSNAFIPVVDPDEALPENQNKRIMLSTLATGGTDNTNFSAYDPNVYYSNAEPDFVSYNGNTYEYINATPAKGKTPATQPAYWKLASAGLFSHKQNTDTHTTSRIFEIGKRLGTVLDINGDPVEEPEGNTILVFAGPEDVKTAIRYVWETIEGVRIDKLQFTNNYAGGTIPVWVDFGAAGSSDAATTDYTPADSNNTTGFFAGLLTSGKLKVKAALDAIVTAVKAKLDKLLSIQYYSASHTLALVNSAGLVQMDSASALTLTVPPNSSVAFPIGTQIIGVQMNSGQVTVVAGSGVTIGSEGAKYKTIGQYSGFTLVKVGTDTWYLFGGLTA